MSSRLSLIAILFIIAICNSDKLYAAETNMQYVGDFEYVDSSEGSCDGYIVALWKMSDSLVGYLRHYSSECSDPRTGIIEDVQHNPSTGNLTFKVKLWASSCIAFKEGRCVYSKDLLTFKGLLKAENLSGSISWYSLDQKKNIYLHQVSLKLKKDSDEYDKSPASYDMFVKEWKEVFGPKWNSPD
ncbi:MAG: hypothetical protein KJ795_00800 [Gammaproteobacteria bacterium]|nr:hypothetical protein [Gammaproteobacteria bacterium]